MPQLPQLKANDSFLTRIAAFRTQLAVPSTLGPAYVKPMLIFDGLAEFGVGIAAVLFDHTSRAFACQIAGIAAPARLNS
jgi:hypothetical protein